MGLRYVNALRLTRGGRSHNLEAAQTARPRRRVQPLLGPLDDTEWDVSRRENHAITIRVAGTLVLTPQTSPTITRAIFSPPTDEGSIGLA
jgi:hypothetical protein